MIIPGLAAPFIISSASAVSGPVEFVKAYRYERNTEFSEDWNATAVETIGSGTYDWQNDNAMWILAAGGHSASAFTGGLTFSRFRINDEVPSAVETYTGAAGEDATSLRVGLMRPNAAEPTTVTLNPVGDTWYGAFAIVIILKNVEQVPADYAATAYHDQDDGTGTLTCNYTSIEDGYDLAFSHHDSGTSYTWSDSITEIVDDTYTNGSRSASYGAARISRDAGAGDGDIQAINATTNVWGSAVVMSVR